MQWTTDWAFQPWCQWLLILRHKWRWIHHQNCPAQGGRIPAEAVTRLLYGKTTITKRLSRRSAVYYLAVIDSRRKRVHDPVSMLDCRFRVCDNWKLQDMQIWWERDPNSVVIHWHSRLEWADGTFAWNWIKKLYSACCFMSVVMLVETDSD